jgi:membrane protease YdiL (CAAX protease family)
MPGFVLIIAFPLILGAGFGGLYLVADLLPQGREKLNQTGILLYPLFLAIPFVVAFIIVFKRDMFAEVGIRMPAVLNFSNGFSIAVALAVGLATGPLLFYNELYVSARLQKLTGRTTLLSRVLEGQTHALPARRQEIPFVVIMALSVFVVFAEEFLWRGFLIRHLTKEFSLSAALALFISAVSFGLNHYYFGVRNIVFKSFLGLIWGMLYLLTSSILISFVSHYAFEYLAWRRSRP